MWCYLVNRKLRVSMHGQRAVVSHMTSESLQSSLLHPTCAIRPGEAASRRSSAHEHLWLVLMTTVSTRLPLAHVQHELWIRHHDHLISCEAREHIDHPLVWLCGMFYGSPPAHRALASVLCAHRATASHDGRPHDWLLVVDDDTVVRVPYLDGVLRGASPHAIPSMLGSRVDMQLNGSLDSGCPASVPHIGGSRSHRHSVFNVTTRVPCSNAVDRSIRNLPWGFSVHHLPGEGWAQRGAWAVGWPYGGHGIVISRAAVVALERVGSDCLLCLTCPFYGTYTSRLQAHGANPVTALGPELVRAEASLGFGSCGEKHYDEASHTCADAYNGMYEWDERHERHRFVPDKHCNTLSMRCGETDVQLGLCFGRAGYAPQATPRGGWSAHLNAERANLTAFWAATSAFLRGLSLRG